MDRAAMCKLTLLLTLVLSWMIPPALRLGRSYCPHGGKSMYFTSDEMDALSEMWLSLYDNNDHPDFLM